MRISDWSSDVCSSDLGRVRLRHAAPLLDTTHRPRPQPRRPEVQRRVAPGALLGSAHGGAGLDHAALRQAVRPGRGTGDRKSVVWGKRVSVRVDHGGPRIIKKKKIQK